MTKETFEAARIEDIDSDKKLGDLITSKELSEKEKKAILVNDSDAVDSFEKDFELARETIISILENSDGVIAGMTEIAKESDSPRAYEVLANMMNNFISSSRELIDLHEKKVKIKEKKDAVEGPKVQNNTQNNIVFSGSPNDLLDQLEKSKNNGKS